MNKIKSTLTIIFSVAVIAGVLFGASKLDAKREAAWNIYEACVIREYNTTPAAWHEAYGEVPPCD